VTDIRNANDDLMYQTNFLASRDVFDVAGQFGTKVIFTSSAAVYGDSKVPHKEDGSCVPVSKYGKYKLKAEGLAKGAFVARLFNVYGPGSKSFVNKLCKKFPAYEEIVIYGNGLSTRDYVYVTDIVDALLLGIEKSGVYNVGTGVETSILDLIDTFRAITKFKPPTRYTLPLENEIMRSRADIEKIRNLGWEPKVSLEEGIRLLLNEMGVKFGLP
jgi:UDP-glucose 4-epimerase